MPYHSQTIFSPFPRDVVFGPLGTTFQHKWQGKVYAHPHKKNKAQEALHWAHLVAKNDQNYVTI